MKHYVVIWGAYSLIAVFAEDEADARKKMVDWAVKTWSGEKEVFEMQSKTADVYELGEEPVYLGRYYD